MCLIKIFPGCDLLQRNDQHIDANAEIVKALYASDGVDILSSVRAMKGGQVEIGASSMIMFSAFMVCSAAIAFIGVQFYKGKWLEHITLIDLSKHDREGIAKISSTMLFTIALSFSAAVTLSFWVNALAVSFGVMTVMIAVCLIGYICMARTPRTAA